jgi:cysteine desulfurase
MERIYLDNAATTPLDPAVLEAMMPYMTTHFGNPSSIYSYGRETRLAIENARKKVAALLNTRPSEIFFTSGGTESSNTAIHAAVYDLGCTHIISSPIEHHATSHTVEHLNKIGAASLSYVKLLPNGHIDIADLELLLKNSDKKCLVTLMHANNEIGNMIDLHQIGNLCNAYNAIFHSDTVQTVGHFPFDLKNTPVHFITGAGHKFHGPKGVGFAYVRKNLVLQPMIFGGEQEKGWRAGTESVHQIAGMAKALELSFEYLNEERKYITDLKQYCFQKLQQAFPEFSVNGDDTFYNILNVLLPFSPEKTAMILFNLDMKGISVSRGSACQSGSAKPSHVLAEMLNEGELKKPSLRISFSHYNTKEEIDCLISALNEI